jgi:hypothetical protein
MTTRFKSEEEALNYAKIVLGVELESVEEELGPLEGFGGIYFPKSIYKPKNPKNSEYENIRVVITGPPSGKEREMIERRIEELRKEYEKSSEGEKDSSNIALELFTLGASLESPFYVWIVDKSTGNALRL